MIHKTIKFNVECSIDTIQYLAVQTGLPKDILINYCDKHCRQMRTVLRFHYKYQYSIITGPLPQNLNEKGIDIFGSENEFVESAKSELEKLAKLHAKNDLFYTFNAERVFTVPLNFFQECHVMDGLLYYLEMNGAYTSRDEMINISDFVDSFQGVKSFQKVKYEFVPKQELEFDEIRSAISQVLPNKRVIKFGRQGLNYFNISGIRYHFIIKDSTEWHSLEVKSNLLNSAADMLIWGTTAKLDLDNS